MKKNKCRTHSPHPICWANGVLDRWMKTASTEPESGLVRSAFVEKTRIRFDEFSKRQIYQMDQKLAEDRSRAAALVAEMENVQIPTEPDPVAEFNVRTCPIASPEEGRAARAAARSLSRQRDAFLEQSKKREDALIRRTQARQELAEIRDRMLREETNVRYRLEICGEDLKDYLCSYSHGVLSRPVDEKQLWSFPVENYFEMYHRYHADSDRQITAMLKEEEK